MNMLTKFKNEPMINFSIPEERNRMNEALISIKKKFGTTYSLADASIIHTTSRQKISSVNPASPKVILGSTECALPADVEVAVQHVFAGKKNWAWSTEKRIELVCKLALWMRKNRYELMAWMVYEVGKTWREADADVCEAIDFCSYYACEMERLGTPRITQLIAGESNTLTYMPKGVAVVIAPWNFPLAILTGMAVAALVTGNTVIIKPAEQSVMIAAKLIEGLVVSGFPKEVFYFLPGVGEEIGPMLVDHPLVDLVVFTGSASVGFSIIETGAKKPKSAAKGVKKIIAEMGGKNALIIDEDADIDEAVLGALHSAFGFQGQKCSALSRLLVHESIYESFISRFIDATRSLRIGSPESPDFQLGPVIDEVACERIKQVITRAKTKNKLLYGGELGPSLEGYFVAPHIFEVDHIEDELLQEEIFGPVVAVKKIKNLDEAITCMNQVKYALTGGIYSRMPSHIEQVKREAEVGNLYINRAITGAIVERHPFGGFKFSGLGTKAGGSDYLIQFMDAKTISENTVRKGFAAETE